MYKLKVIEILRLFNEKAEELKRSQYLKSIIENDTGSSIVMGLKGNITVTVNGPDDEAIKAFVLTFRFFIQDNERCSIKNVAKIYDELELPNDIKDNFRYSRNGINSYLDTNYSAFKPNNEIIPFRNILDVFFYGGLAHANQEKKHLYDKWISNIVIKGILIPEFHAVLGTMFYFIIFVQGLNQKVIEILLNESV